MKTRYYFLLVSAIVLLGSLAFWQLRNLSATQNLKSELEVKEIQSTLMNTAVNLRELERINVNAKENKSKQFLLIDSLIRTNFKVFDFDFEWGIVDQNGILDKGLFVSDSPDRILSSNIKVCLSCLVNISIVNDSSEINDPGFILSHSPAQMMQFRGLEPSKVKFIHLWYNKERTNSIKTYILPIIFIMGLMVLFLLLLDLMRKQSLLINQKNEFVNHLSHQFQTPLSSIKIGANLLAKKYKSEELIQIIQTEGNRLENHIKTVLHWVKSDADRLQVLKEDVRITDCIENAIKEMIPVFQTNQTIIQFVPPENEYVIRADINHLQLMLFNLWENSIKHNDHPVQIKIAIKKQDKLLKIEVSDNGKGAQDLTDIIKYNGLGLQYIETIMKEHKGSINLLDNVPNGFTVILNFPINE